MQEKQEKMQENEQKTAKSEQKVSKNEQKIPEKEFKEERMGQTGEKGEELVIDPSKIKPSKGINIDYEKFDKKLTKIEFCDLKKVPSQYVGFPKDEEGNIVKVDDFGNPINRKVTTQWVLNLKSELLEVVEYIKEGEKQTLDVRASELFNLTQDENGVLVGFPTDKKSNLSKLCNDLKINLSKINNLEELMKLLVGKEIMMKSYTKGEGESKKTYLKFRY